MATNPYLQWWTDTAEQQLIRDLSDETIQMFGFDIVYLPATLRREDPLYNEDVLRQFTRTFPIEAYLENAEGWQGQGNLMSKFGLQLNNQFNIRISRQRFAEIVAQFTGQTRPLEGDMVWMGAPFNAMFEIKYVEHQKTPGQFYPLGTLTYYQLQLELHTYNQEKFATNDSTIDAVQYDNAYAVNLELSTDGSGTYQLGETAYQGDSVAGATATGIVSEWNASTRVLKVTYTKGTFANGIIIQGATSNAAYVIAEEPVKMNNPNEAVDDNTYLDASAMGIIDLREVNRSQG